MKNHLNMSALIVPISYFSILYIKAFLHAMDEHQKFQEKIAKDNKSLSQTTIFERFKKTYHPIFPLIPEGKSGLQDAPKPKI